MNLQFKIIEKDQIEQIIPLLKSLNVITPENILRQRVLKMVDCPNYECAGVFDKDKLIGISGLWYMVRHYIGTSVEPDHVIIDQGYRGNKVGEQFFDWIREYTQKKGCEAIELNTYSGNRKSHKFYYNQGYEIYGFHFVKVIRKDKEFY